MPLPEQPQSEQPPSEQDPDRNNKRPEVLEGTLLPAATGTHPARQSIAPGVPPRGTHAEGYLPPRRTAPVAIGGAILAIVGLLLAWLPFVGLVLAAAGLVLGIFARLRKKAGPVFTTVIMVLGALGTLAGLLSTGLVWWAVTEAGRRGAFLLLG